MPTAQAPSSAIPTISRIGDTERRRAWRGTERFQRVGYDLLRRTRTARSTEKRPRTPMTLTSAQYGHPAKGSPVLAGGTVDPEVVVVDPPVVVVGAVVVVEPDEAAVIGMTAEAPDGRVDGGVQVTTTGVVPT